MDPVDKERFSPIGGIGELVLEGPLVGAGYLHNEESTRAAFLEDPEWLLRGLPKVTPGRRGRLYRTGDLVRYTDDLQIDYFGRRDSQVKIRGQRVELGEVAAHLHTLVDPSIQWCLEVAELQNGAELLIVFLVAPMNGGPGSATDLLRATANVVDPEMRRKLPPAMIPGAYACIDEIPLSLTGKTDHRKLKREASSLSADRIYFPSINGHAMQPNGTTNGQPHENEASGSEGTKLESLRRLWSEVFNVEAESIHDSDTFFNHGGESLAAIRLVSAASRKGLHLDVATIFRHPRLSDLASRCRLSHASLPDAPPPFSLLTSLQVLSELAASCGTSIDDIEDAYPCTPLQQGIITSSSGPDDPQLSTPAKYVGRQVLPLPRHIDTERLAKAWHRVTATHPVLRTRIVDTARDGLVQAVMKESDLCVAFEARSDLASYLKADAERPMGLGTDLCRWAVVRQTGSTYFVLTMHHAIYDGWTLPRLGAEVFRAYRGERLHPGLGFNSFVKHIALLPTRPGDEFWAGRLAGPGTPVVFPEVPHSAREPRADSSLSKAIPAPANANDNISMPSLLRAAWALLVSGLSGDDDVVFGATVSGRNVPVDGVEDLLGPTISTVPVRVKINGAATVRDFVESVQNEALEAMPFEHMGLQNIRKINADTRERSRFQTLLIIHPPSTVSTTLESHPTTLSPPRASFNSSSRTSTSVAPHPL